LFSISVVDPPSCFNIPLTNVLNILILFAFVSDAPSINNNRYGYIMNVYFNMTFILNQLEALKDKDNRVSVFKLIQCLCDGWNRATGGFSKLRPSIDSDTNTFKIIDEVQLPNRDEVIKSLNKNISTELAFFDVYGYFKGGPQAGFIRDLSFTTTVSPNLATLITVGATSNGYVVGQDSTALSRMNAGLTDRFKKTIKLGPEIETLPSMNSINQDYSNALDAYNVFVGELGSWNGTEKPKWNVEAITAFNNTATQFYEYDQAKQTLEASGLSSTSASLAALSISASPKSAGKSSPNCGFLPFDLSLTMDGLSGMKVYQKYIIDTDFLPTNYPTSLEFIIRTITNTIQANQWTTTLDSIAIPKNPFGSTISTTPTTPATVAGYLLLEDQDGFNGYKQVTVTSATTFTYTTTNSSLGTPAQGTLQLSAGTRVEYAATPARIAQYYSENSSGVLKNWMFVVLGGTSIYKNDTIASDLSTAQTRNQNYWYQSQRDLSIYVALSSKSSTLGGAEADTARSYESALLKSLANHVFNSALSDSVYQPTVYVANETDDYVDAYYIHRFDFLAKGFITKEDTAAFSNGTPLQLVNGTITDKGMTYKPTTRTL